MDIAGERKNVIPFTEQPSIVVIIITINNIFQNPGWRAGWLVGRMEGSKDAEKQTIASFFHSFIQSIFHFSIAVHIFLALLVHWHRTYQKLYTGEIADIYF